MQQLLEESGAILRGHFILASGRRSDVYFEKFRILERPDILTQLCGDLAKHAVTVGADIVAGPTTGGIIVAMDTARQAGLPSLYVESEEGKRKLRRNAQVAPGSKVYVVDDVLTTGKSVLEVIDLFKSLGATVCGVGVLISRAETPINFGAPLYSAFDVEAKTYSPDDLPESLRTIEPVKPGTSQVST